MLNADAEPPEAIRSYASSPTTVVVLFSEPLDSAEATVLSHYSADRGLTFTKAVCQPPLFDQVILETAFAMDTAQVYQLIITGIRDCGQNEAIDPSIIKTGLAVASPPGNCVINEILFDPGANAYDYVEIYNHGPGLADAGAMYITNRNSLGQFNAPLLISPEPYLIFPGDYVVITESAAVLSLNYLVRNPLNVLELGSLPSFPDDRGSVVLLDATGQLLDEVNYSRNWHFKLIDNPEGVSLERVDPLGSSADPGNWHSAASTAGFGTPTYVNSQFKKQEEIGVQIKVIPPVFSPDNDGRDDITTLHYKTGEQGLVATIFIFDAAGRLVRNLVQNELLGDSGYWNWNGTDNANQLLSVGIYIIQTELFNLVGNIKRIRSTVVLAKKLNFKKVL
ncbi:MAG: hypothetical protein EOP49_43950 [Sphingobacteriales bacterium]|nr:MAG: hypothetical protein EOP49_43950 [Sphingobacteriales bacterium]